MSINNTLIYFLKYENTNRSQDLRRLTYQLLVFNRLTANKVQNHTIRLIFSDAYEFVRNRSPDVIPIARIIFKTERVHL